MAPISRRTFAAFLATAALTPVLGGCSSTSAGSSAEGEGAATTDAGASAQRQITV